MIAFRDLFNSLLSALGPQKWWPADSSFEMMIGAVLVQHTAWTNVEKSIAALKDAELLEPEILAGTDSKYIANIIRPSGFMNTKSQSCIDLSRWVIDSNALSGELDSLTDDEIGAQLVNIKGIGPETSDVILLYVFNRPRFIWDTYARKLLAQVGYQVPDSYLAAKKLLDLYCREANFRVSELAEFHGLIVEYGKKFSRIKHSQTDIFSS